MSNKRTKQEKARIIEKCLDIEAEGGDVLGYLRDMEHYVSPGATWFNIQRIDLARDPYHRTSGKPTGVKIPRQQTPAAILDALQDEEAKKEPEKMDRLQRSKWIRKTVAEMLTEGRRDDAVAFLKEQGVKQIDQMLYAVRHQYGMKAGNPGPKQKPKNEPRPAMSDEVKKTVTIPKIEPVKNESNSSPYQFVRIREIENDLEREFVRLITHAYLMPCGSDLEMIQEEIFLCLSQIRAVREVKNLGRKALRKEAG
jgi:hypothetical protein